ARRADLLRLLVLLLFLPGVLREERLELGLLRRREELRRELVAELLVGGGDRLHLGGVRGVRVVRALALAGADPEDEADDDRDRNRDQPDEPRERGEARRRRARRPGRALVAAAAAVARHLEPRQAPALGRLDRLRLVEEVEIE